MSCGLGIDHGPSHSVGVITYKNVEEEKLHFSFARESCLTATNADDGAAALVVIIQPNEIYLSIVKD